MLLSTLPLFPTFPFDPELTFVLFVPPLLYRTAATSSLRDTRRNARPIFLLAVALVLVTIAAVAAVAHSLAPRIPWAAAFVLAAIVSPSDADITTQIVRRLGLPARIVTILEGETLLNDTTAFVSYRMAVQAAALGSFSLTWAVGAFVAITIGGLAVGLAVGWVFRRLRPFITDPIAVSIVSLLIPFIAYLLAERFNASGVLAVVSQRTRLDLDDTEHAAGGHTGLTLEDSIRDAEQQVREASREAVARLRDAEVIGDAVFKKVISDLDLDQVRNIDEPIL